MAFGDIVQAVTASANSGTTLPVSISAATAGNLLECNHFTGASAAIVPSGYSTALTLTDGGDNDEGKKAYKIAVGGETSVVPGSGSSSEHVAIVIEYEGPFDSVPLDKTAQNEVTVESNTSSGTTPTTAQADEIASAMILIGDGSAAQFSGWTNSFVERGEADSDYKAIAVATRLLTATGAYETSADHDNTRSMGGIATYKAATAGDIDQEGFRWRIDDDNEADATWAADQDVDYDGVDLDTNIRLRVILATDDDPDSTAFALEYEKDGEGSFVQVPVGSTSVDDVVIEAGDVTVTTDRTGLGDPGDPNVTQDPHTVEMPAYADGDLLIINHSYWADGGTDWRLDGWGTGPNGETVIEVSDGYGDAGSQSGDRPRIALAYFIGDGSAAADSEALACTYTGGTRHSSSVVKLPAGEFDPAAPISAQVGVDSSLPNDSSPNFGALTSASDDDGGKLVVILAADQDPISGEPTGYTNLGGGSGEPWDQGRVACSLNVRDAAVTDSESITPPSAWSITNDAWVGVAYIVRPAAATTNRCYIATSAHIAAGGEDTTEQLTPPASGSFATGRMWDDENGTDELNIPNGDWMPLEWCVHFPTAGGALDNDAYNFRVADLATYGVTPQITINTEGGTLFFQTNTGAVTPTGALTRATTFARTVAGALTPTGAITKETQKNVAGTLTPTGDITKETTKTFSGSVTPTGALVPIVLFFRALAGAVTPTGTLVKRTLKSVAGALTPTGTIVKATQKNVTGALTPTGATTKETAKTLSGSVTPTGALAPIVLFFRAVAGALTPTGAVTKQTQKSVVGTVTPTGAIIKETQKNVAGAVAPVGDIKKDTAKSVSGDVAPTGALTAGLIIAQTVLGALAPTGVLGRLFIDGGGGPVGRIYRRVLTLITALSHRNEDQS